MSVGTSAFLGGLITMAFVIVGLFFVKFWSQTRDSLFIAFAGAFWLLALSQALVALSVVPREERSWIYLLRVAAFVVIALAIVQKNTGRGVRRDGLPPRG